MAKTESQKHSEIACELDEIARELDTLALRMRSTAAKMQDCKAVLIVAHGNEIAKASELVREWAKWLRVERNQECTATSLVLTHAPVLSRSGAEPTTGLGRMDSSSDTKLASSCIGIEQSHSSPTEFKVGDLVELLPFPAWESGVTSWGMGVGKVERIKQIIQDCGNEMAAQFESWSYNHPLRALRHVKAEFYYMPTLKRAMEAK